MYPPNQQLVIHTKALNVQDPSALNYNGHMNSSNVARDGCENGGLCQAESAVYSAKKLEGDMQTLGRKIKGHEENIKFLKTHKNSLDESILDLQVTLGKYHSSKTPATEGEDVSVRNEEETVENILKHEKSAAGILCQLKTRHGAQAIPLTKEVLGIVATLGKVHDENLSRLLSEYLGLETMLAVVCTTYDGVKALETYDSEGSVNKASGLHGLGASIGRTLDGRFTVICLEKLRPYVGEFVADDSQRRLDLWKPKLPSGESPPGFLGFAVNMIHVDSSNLFCLTTSGHGLRETLFYHLFSHLQVYRTKAEMLQALPLISHGALSMDGGILKSNGVFRLGSREDLDVKFPVSSGISYLPENYAEIEQRIKEKKWKKERMVGDLMREEQILGHVKHSFEMKKQEFLQFLAQSSPIPAAQSSPYPAPQSYPYPAPQNSPYPAPQNSPYPAPQNSPYPAPQSSPYPAQNSPYPTQNSPYPLQHPYQAPQGRKTPRQ